MANKAEFIKIDSNDYAFSDNYIYYLVLRYLAENGSKSAFQIKNHLYKELELKGQDISASLSRFLDEKFDFSYGECLSDTKKYNLNEDHVALYNRLIKYINFFESNQQITRPISLDEFMYIIQKDYQNFEQVEKDYLFSMYLNVIENYEKDYSKIDCNIQKMIEIYGNNEIETIIFNRKVLNELKRNNINYIKDLINSSIDQMFSILSYDYEICKDSFIIIDKDLVEAFSHYLDKAFSKTDKREYEILLKRSGLKADDKLTLEEIGTKYGLTRERVRQIEKKSLDRISKVFIHTHYQSVRYFFKIVDRLIFKNHKVYVAHSDLVSFFNNSDYADKFCIFTIAIHSIYEFSEKYKIIYKKGELEEILENFNKTHPYISFEDYGNLDSLGKTILSEGTLYEKTENGYQLKAGTRKVANEIRDLIDENFPIGYHVDSDDYSKLKEIYITKHGSDYGFPSSRAIDGYFARDDGRYIQCDRGTFISSKKAAVLSNGLVNKINEYILQFPNVIYYSGIYERFKEELNSFGINNRYYLKGVIDPHLNKKCTKHKDYISIGNKMTALESITKELRKINRPFTFDDIKEKFPGVENYTYLQVLYDRLDVIWLGQDEAIFLKDLKISKELQNKIISQAIKIVDNSGIGLATDKKLYSSIKILFGDELNKSVILKNPRALLSYLSCVVCDKKYKFKKQFMFAGDRGNLSNYEIICDYIYTLDEFSTDNINSFAEKHHTRGLYSFLELYENISDDFVQVDMNKCVRKTKLNLSDESIYKAKKEIDYYLNSFNEIDTRSYRNYFSLPNIGYEWNKYMLAGFIRSYTDYLIENTSNSILTADFIIRRGN